MLVTTLLALVSTSGKLFLAGGGKTPPELVDRFIQHCGGPSALIVVMPLASAEPEKGIGSVKLLEEHGAKNTYFFAKAQPTPADLDELKSKLAVAKGVWMPGGVQSRIVDRLGKGWIDENVRPLLKTGLNFYGTSAGAMVCAEVMITGPGKEPDTAETGPGMGLTSWVVDTHFAQRKREGRLRHALKTTGRDRGVGINEREWLVIQEDEIVEVHGTPTIVDLRPKKDSGRELATAGKARSGRRRLSPISGG
jgi:cyanophycinase